MRLPQSSVQRLSTRVLPIIAVTMFSLCGQTIAQQLSCSPSSLVFGVVPIGQTEKQTVVLTNGLQSSVTVSALNLNTTEFSVSKLGLPVSLSPGHSVALTVAFSPSASGWTSGKAVFTSNASNPTLQLALRGTGVTADAVTASPSTASFGNIAVGAKSTLPIVLTNTRHGSVTVSALQTNGSEFSASSPALPVTLHGGQSMTLKVTFAPRAAGISGGSVYIAGPALAIPLTGTGTTNTVGQLSLNPSILNFGNVSVGTTQTQTLTLGASGSAVTVSSDATTSSQFVLEGASLPFTIPSGKTTSFNVAFTPKTSGSASGSLTFTSNASNSQALESLTGAGEVTLHKVELLWNASPNVAGYNVYRSGAANGTFTKINPTMDANTAYTDTNVVSSQTYYYEATSVNSAGEESTRSTPPVPATIP
jgi:Abnormal spindle-like microcephaly-assoc'd, ASPM-SPD-2-Hydin